MYCQFSRDVPFRPVQPCAGHINSSEYRADGQLSTWKPRVCEISGNGMYVKKRMVRNPEYSNVMIRGLSDQGYNPTIEKNFRDF